MAKKSLGIRLAQACYQHYHAAGMAWDHVIARADMVPFFVRLGYVPMASGAEFPGVGPMTPLRLNLDPTYLMQVGSMLVAGVT